MGDLLRQLDGDDVDLLDQSTVVSCIGELALRVVLRRARRQVLDTLINYRTGSVITARCDRGQCVT